MSIKVSILMPIFNAEPFLEQSLSSAMHQSLKEIEIVCVNDGSKDGSLDIMKKYQKRDDRIKIIDKENAGYGHAMNIALDNATGEYIAILEPDDFLDLNMCENLYQRAIENDLDVIKSNYYENIANEDKYFEVLWEQKYDIVTSAKENDRIIVMRPCIWTALYKREFLEKNHIRFNETPGASYQDTSFAFKVWVSADRVMFVKDAYLHYRMDNENSSVNSSGKIFSICDEFNAMDSFLKAKKEYKDRFSKVLQAIKWDSYNWNLGRIAEEYKPIFEEQIAIDYIKAKYENVLDEKYFDEWRWSEINNLISKYEDKECMLLHYINLEKAFNDMKHSKSFRVGRLITGIPRKIRDAFR